MRPSSRWPLVLVCRQPGHFQSNLYMSHVPKSPQITHQFRSRIAEECRIFLGDHLEQYREMCFEHSLAGALF